MESNASASGKPLKDHEEVVGHASAIELIWRYIARESDFTKAASVGWVGAKRKPTVRWKMVGFHFVPTHLHLLQLWAFFGLTDKAKALYSNSNKAKALYSNSNKATEK